MITKLRGEIKMKENIKMSTLAKMERITHKHQKSGIRMDRFMWEAGDLRILTPKENNKNNSVERTDKS